MYAIFYAFQPSFTHKLREIYSLLDFVFVVILVSYMVSYCYASLLFVVVWMVVVPIQVQVRLKDDFTIPVNTEPTSASAILVRNH